MSKLQTFKRLNHNDYPEEQQDLIRQISGSYNIGMEEVYNAFNRNISFDANLDSCIPNFTVTVDTNGNPVESTTFQIHKSQGINGLQVIRADNLNNPNTFPTGGIHITWEQNSDRIIINNIVGLPEGEEFAIKVLVIG